MSPLSALSSTLERDYGIHAQERVKLLVKTAIGHHTSGYNGNLGRSQRRRMKKMTTADRARFQSGAQAYAAYLEKPEGRLRLDLAFANLQEFLPQVQSSIMRSGCRRRHRRNGQFA